MFLLLFLTGWFPWWPARVKGSTLDSSASYAFRRCSSPIRLGRWTHRGQLSSETTCHYFTLDAAIFANLILEIRLRFKKGGGVRRENLSSDLLFLGWGGGFYKKTLIPRVGAVQKLILQPKSPKITALHALHGQPPGPSWRSSGSVPSSPGTAFWFPKTKRRKRPHLVSLATGANPPQTLRGGGARRRHLQILPGLSPTYPRVILFKSSGAQKPFSLSRVGGQNPAPL